MNKAFVQHPESMYGFPAMLFIARKEGMIALPDRSVRADALYC